MTIDKQSWFYRAWASTYVDDRQPPQHTTLCRMFWRALVSWALRLAVLGALLFFVGLFGLSVWRTPAAGVYFVAILGVIAGTCGVVVAVGYVVDFLSGPRLDAVRNNIPVAVFRAWKEKVCPLVTFTDTEHEDGAA